MNKNKIIAIFIFTIAIMFNGASQAQVKSSIYSMFGVGELTDNNYGVNRALGGTGIAFQSGRSVNYLNPASYLGVLPNSYVMEFGAYGIYNRSETKHYSQTDADVNLGYFSASLYIYDWWAGSVGIVPFSSIDYKVKSTGSIEGELTTFDKTYEGSGGLNRIYFGNSFNVYKGLALGFNLSYVFGPISQTETAESATNFSGYTITNDRNVHGVYLDYGLQYLLNYDDWLYTFGATYGANTKLNSSDEKTFEYNDETISLDQNALTDIKVPQKFGFGLSAKKGDNFRAGIDYEYGNWAAINFSNTNYSTTNSNRLSFGAEYKPGSDKNDEPWYNTLLYRLGGNYKNSYLRIDNTRISTMGISAGIGIPYDRNSMVNISAEYGKEGTTNNGLIRNDYLIVYFNISLYEFWAKRLRD
jgi:hypothetical protein